MPQTFAIILFLNSFIVNACYTAASVNIQHSLAGWSLVVIWKKSLVLRKHTRRRQ